MIDRKKKLIIKALLMFIVYTVILLGISCLGKGYKMTVIIWLLFGGYQSWRWLRMKLKEMRESDSE